MSKYLKHVLIDYKLLSDAVEYYTELGYKRIEVPWYVDEKYSIATSPTNDRGIAFCLDDGQHLVCSAEQAFIQLMDDQLKEYTNYFAVSPCFRNETEDDLHCKQFIKLELFSFIQDYTIHKDFYRPEKIGHIHFIYDAFNFFKRYNKNISQIQINSNQIDIITNSGIELGSYGQRDVFNNRIFYGTGLALPRFTAGLTHEK